MVGLNPVSGESKRAPILDDPFLWLEEIEGDRALAWVHDRNRECFDELESDARYATLLEQAEALLNAKDRIPYGSVRGGHVYNFWRDARHVRGILRRTPLASYRLAKPEWETVLDIDALAFPTPEPAIIAMRWPSPRMKTGFTRAPPGWLPVTGDAS